MKNNRKSIKIDIPEGYEVDQEKSTFENIVFKPLDTINNMDDVYRLNGTTEKEFLKKWEGFEDHEVAMAQERLIVTAYNKGEKPDWNSTNQKKWYLYFQMNNFSYYSSGYHYSSSSPVAARLCFLREEDCKEAVEKFIDIYKRSRLG